MNMPDKLNAAMKYIEENLCGEINPDEIARRACVTKDSFARFFSYMTGMTLNEYVRKRKLSLAGEEIRQSDAKIIDIALKYGYESADAFSRAFARQHGISPADARRGAALKIYPPASFHIIIKGAKEMNFRMIELQDTAVYGVSRKFDEKEYASREELRHMMWSEDCDDVPGQIVEGRWNEPGRHSYDGVWYGLWRDGSYMIAREKDCVRGENLEERIIASGTYAAFTSERGGYAGDEIPKLWSLIFDSWLPDSGYALRNGDVIEVFHLWNDKAERKKNRYYEIWVPVMEKQLPCTCEYGKIMP